MVQADKYLKIILIGSVNSSFATLKKIIENQMNLIAVFGLKYPSVKSRLISGYCDLQEISKLHNIHFFEFQRINDHSLEIERLGADIIFIVGLSQLVKDEIINSASLGCIGFHPTMLPQGRGRAPLAWLIREGEKRGAATFFQITQGIDSGSIFIQQPFYIAEDDYVRDIEIKMLGAINSALDEWLPSLKKGVWNPTPQLNKNATYYGQIKPEDSYLDWREQSATEIIVIIRASSRPHPGGYCYFENLKMIVWHAKNIAGDPVIGIPGRITSLKNGEIVVKCKEGSVLIDDYTVLDSNDNDQNYEFRVGENLFINEKEELWKIKKGF